jgi:hypothetical protein
MDEIALVLIGHGSKLSHNRELGEVSGNLAKKISV